LVIEAQPLSSAAVSNSQMSFISRSIVKKSHGVFPAATVNRKGRGTFIHVTVSTTWPEGHRRGCYSPPFSR
jgi:hypothetical protein